MSRKPVQYSDLQDVLYAAVQRLMSIASSRDFATAGPETVILPAGGGNIRDDYGRGGPLVPLVVTKAAVTKAHDDAYNKAADQVQDALAEISEWVDAGRPATGSITSRIAARIVGG